MENDVRRGQTVYAADGTYLGGVLQCDSRVVVIGRSRFTCDHVVVPVEEVAASASDVLILRDLPEAIRPETAEPWTLPPDASGNANGVDLEPLRAGMAEIEDEGVGTAPASGRREAPRPAEWNALLPSPEDVWRLDGERVARLDAEIDRCLAEEIEDFEIGAGCAPPASEEPAQANVEDRRPAPAEEIRKSEEPPPRRGGSAPRRATRAAAKAARSSQAFERMVQGAGFSRAEARAIAAGGFAGLASFVESLRPGA